MFGRTVGQRFSIFGLEEQQAQLSVKYKSETKVFSKPALLRYYASSLAFIRAFFRILFIVS